MGRSDCAQVLRAKVCSLRSSTHYGYPFLIGGRAGAQCYGGNAGCVSDCAILLLVSADRDYLISGERTPRVLEVARSAAACSSQRQAEFRVEKGNFILSETVRIFSVCKK